LGNRRALAEYKMSAKLLRRLLHQTSDLDFSLHSGEKTNKKSRKRKKAETEEPADQQEIINHQVQSMLFMDQQIAYGGTKKTVTADRLRDEQQKERKIRKKVAGLVVGNSRDASSKMRQKPEPTFNKEHQKIKKDKERMRKIGRLLRQHSKKSPKGKK
jgi:hypothetical protein